MKNVTISACTYTLNNAHVLDDCLKSLTWADELIVVDSGSTDDTVGIAKKYTEKIHNRAWTGFCDQLNYISEIATGPWVLIIDADERCPDDLSREIRERVQHKPDNAAFYLPRLTRYLGKWMRHGEFYPDYTIRLYRKGMGTYQGEPHAKYMPVGNVEYLTNHILHLGFENISHQLKTTDTYTNAAAREMYEKNTRLPSFKLLVHPPVRFFKAFLWKRGFLDGWQGFILACMSAYAVLVKYAKLIELHNTSRKPQ